MRIICEEENEVTYSDDLIKLLKEMYTINDGELVRVSDCSMRDFTSHPTPSENICQMKIADIPTRDIAYMIQYNRPPEGRVVYKDGNRKNHSMENLFIVSCEDYEKAVNVALQVLAETKIKEVEINSPKDLIKLLAIKGLDSIGYENVSAIIKLSALGRAQKARAMKYIRGLTTSST